MCLHQLFFWPASIFANLQLGTRTAEPHWVFNNQTCNHFQHVHSFMNLVALEVLKQVGILLHNPGWENEWYKVGLKCLTKDFNEARMSQAEPRSSRKWRASSVKDAGCPWYADIIASMANVLWSNGPMRPTRHELSKLMFSCAAWVSLFG